MEKNKKNISLIPEVVLDNVTNIIKKLVTESSNAASGNIQNELVNELAENIKEERKTLASKALDLYDAMFTYEKAERKNLKPLPGKVTASGIKVEDEYSEEEVTKLVTLVNNLNTLNSHVAIALNPKSSNKESWNNLDNLVKLLTKTYAFLLKG